MSEKIEEIRSVRKVHAFYCDRCEKLIGKSEEDDDGSYTRFGNSLPTLLVQIPFDTMVEKNYLFRCNSPYKILCGDCWSHYGLNLCEAVLKNLRQICTQL